jgi:glycosyltransferase involved in cell wall biosynthesis
LRNSPRPQNPDPAATSGESADRDPRILMLGLGWFPTGIGGLDRYYRGLFEALAPSADGVVIGPAPQAPSSIHAVASEHSPLVRRLLAFRAAAIGLGDEAEVLDAHFALYALAPLHARSLRSKPAVFHFHGPWADENVAAGDGSQVNQRLRQTVERRALARAGAIVVLSSAFKRVLVERYGISPWRIEVIPPGVDLERFTPGERSEARAVLDIEPDAFVVVCARRLVERMGIETLLDAWAKVGPELPAGSTLLLIGDGPLREALTRRAAAAPLAGRVRVLGRVSDAELIDAYRAADVAAVPSLAFEGFGLVVLEAAACGTPSIVSNVGGLPEVSAGLDRSLVVLRGDAEALGARLLDASHGELPSRQDSRSYAERFDWASAADRHRRLYRRLSERRPDERMRVVYLDHVARLSGGEIALLRLLPHFERVDAHVILAEEGPLAQRLAEAGISVEVLAIAPSARDVRKDSVGAIGAAPGAMFQTMAHAIRLAIRLRRLKPDLVHSNSLKSGFYGALAARLAGVPMLWHLRDRIADDYLPGAAVRLTRTLIARLAHGVIANSDATLETAPRSSRHRVHLVIPDSVQRSEIPRAQPSQTSTFGMLGRIAPWKGQDLFLRAFAEAFPDGGERAVIVGTPMFGEQDFERELRRLVGELGLDGRVEFRGFREDIWRELASFDVLVHASVIPEPFGQVVLEGMAAGLAVIAPDEGGPASIIRHGETGLLFHSRDSTSLAAAMRGLRDDPAERERLGDGALSALAEYHPTVVCESLEQSYEQLLRASRTGARGSRR